MYAHTRTALTHAHGARARMDLSTRFRSVNYTMCCWLLCFWTRSMWRVYMYVYVYYVHTYTIIIMWSVPETFEKILLLLLSRINVVSPGAESPNEPSKALQRLHTRSAPRPRRFIIRRRLTSRQLRFLFWSSSSSLRDGRERRKKIFELLKCERPMTKQKLYILSRGKKNPTSNGPAERQAVTVFAVQLITVVTSLVKYAEKYPFRIHPTLG